MHTIVETAAYLRQSKEEGMTAEERATAVNLVAAAPLAGDLIVGSGGYRKVRVPGRGKGKSGGYRIVTFYAGERAPTFLVAVLYKGSRANFSDAEVAAMAKAAKTLVTSLGPLAIG